MCTSPIQLKDPATGLLGQYACGVCHRCRNRRRWQWIGRMVLEGQLHAHSRFLTLTYAQDPGLLDPGHLSSFMKLYRYHYGRCRFFGVGEYGERNGRGHFHVIIYGHSPVVVGHWKDNKAWDYGYSYDGNATIQSMAYVGGYVMKTGDDKEHRPFVRMSLRPGIGFPRIDDMARAAPKDLSRWPHEYFINGKSYPLCQGGLARFQTSYLENGGLPPASSNPIVRDLRTRASWLDLGTRFEAQEFDRKQFTNKDDKHALPRSR